MAHADLVPAEKVPALLGIEDAVLWDAADLAHVKETLKDRRPHFRIADFPRILEAVRQLPKKRQWQLYIIRRGEKGPFKIGVTMSPNRRLTELQIGNAERLTLIHIEVGGHKLERAAHKALAAFRLKGEWFARSPEVSAFIQAARKGGIQAALTGLSTGQFS